MLVVTRKKLETIEITVPGYEPITVKLISTGRGKAKIGIDAQPDVKILRGEIAELDRLSQHNILEECSK